MRIPVGLKATVNLSHVSTTDNALPVRPSELVGSTAVVSRDSAWRFRVTLQLAMPLMKAWEDKLHHHEALPKAEPAASMQLSAF